MPSAGVRNALRTVEEGLALGPTRPETAEWSAARAAKFGEMNTSETGSEAPQKHPFEAVPNATANFGRSEA
jgi:hypothetical protein